MIRQVLILLGLLALLVSCDKREAAAPASQSPGKPQMTIVVSLYPIYLATINITKDLPHLKVVKLGKEQTGCLHDYMLSPAEMAILEHSQILVINGAGLENFVERLTAQQPQLKIVDAGRDIPLLKDETGEVNPHLWVSVSRMILQVKNIAEQLAVLDPEHATQYRSNAQTYAQKLATLRTEMQRALQNIQHRNIITFHEAFPYFAEEFGLNIVAVVMREPGSEPSARELAETIQKVRAAQVKALFAEPQYSPKAAQTIARETGVHLYFLDPVVTGDNNDPDAYIKIMTKNLQTLVEALQ